VGSNPTPRAYLVVLAKNNKSKRHKKCISRDNLPKTITNTTSKLDNCNSNGEKLEIVQLHNKINSITSNCSKSYFRKILTNLAIANAKNASVICDYLITEETEFNIKTSTKEGKIKTPKELLKEYENSRFVN
jgi:hypothetical protein